MRTFTDIITHYTIDELVTTCMELTIDLAEMPQRVLHYIVMTSIVNGDLREVANVTAKYLSEFREMGIHENTKVLLRKSTIRQTKQYGIGYPHQDGTYHWFAITEQKEDFTEVDAGYEALKQTMLKFDWYYHFTDDTHVWKRGNNAYKAMIQQCKDLGLNEEDARKVQKLCLEERGITSMEGVANINY